MPLLPAQHGRSLDAKRINVVVTVRRLLQATFSWNGFPLPHNASRPGPAGYPGARRKSVITCGQHRGERPYYTHIDLAQSIRLWHSWGHGSAGVFKGNPCLWPGSVMPLISTRTEVKLCISFFPADSI